MSTEPEERCIRRCGGGYEFRVSYRVDHDPETVWAMLTEPEKLAPGHIDPWPGRRARVDFEDSGIAIDSRVDAAEPGRLLIYSWSAGDDPEHPVRREIVPDGTGARLTLSLRLPQDKDAARPAPAGTPTCRCCSRPSRGSPSAFPSITSSPYARTAALRSPAE